MNGSQKPRLPILTCISQLLRALGGGGASPYNALPCHPIIAIWAFYVVQSLHPISPLLMREATGSLDQRAGPSLLLQHPHFPIPFPPTSPGPPLLFFFPDRTGTSVFFFFFCACRPQNLLFWNALPSSAWGALNYLPVPAQSSPPFLFFCLFAFSRAAPVCGIWRFPG